MLVSGDQHRLTTQYQLIILPVQIAFPTSGCDQTKNRYLWRRKPTSGREEKDAFNGKQSGIRPASWTAKRKSQVAVAPNPALSSWAPERSFPKIGHHPRFHPIHAPVGWLECLGR